MRINLILLTTALLLTACSQQPQEPDVKNVILLIGDGMGLGQITALSIEEGNAPLNMERATFTGFQKTYSANNRVTDSSAAGTALATGTKTNNGRLGLDPEGNELESALRVAQKHDKATGLIATTWITDATPGAFYAHVPSRKQYEDIAVQLAGADIDFIVGTGLGHFTKRSDDRNLIEEMAANGYTTAYTREEMDAFDALPAIYLADLHEAVFVATDSLNQRGDLFPASVSKALDLLGTSKDGFFLMAESSLIDYAGHNNDMATLIGEMRDFDTTVGIAFDYAESHPGTLVIVTGDHETGGLTMISPEDDYTAADAGIEYRFSTMSHSGTFIPIMAYGTGAENFTGIMQNADIALKIKALLGE